MTRAVACLLVALAGGCLVVPKDVVHTTALGSRWEDRPGPPGHLWLEAHASGRAIDVVARRARSCARTQIQAFEIRRGREADLVGFDGNDGSGYGLLAVLLLSVVTVPVSGLVTAISLAGDDDVIEREDRVVETVPRACPVLVRKVPVSVTLPSGATVLAATGPGGRVRLELPVEEPRHGPVRVDTAGAWAETYYYADRAACVDHRRGLFEAASTSAAPGAVMVGATWPRCEATTDGDRRHERAWDLLREAVTAASDQRCDLARDALRGVRALDVALHQAALARSPVLTWCAAEDARDAATVRDCRARRQQRAREAAVIRDVNERGRALRSLPSCP